MPKTLKPIIVQDLALLAGKPHGERLEEWAEGATQIHVFVSFLFAEGVDLVKTLLKHAPVDLIVSTYFNSTREQALVDLLALLKSKRTSPNKLRVKVAHGPSDGYHGKFYRFVYADGTARVVVGSANLSRTGLEGLGEVSLMVAGLADTIPSLNPEAIPSLKDKDWATAEQPEPLVEVISSYNESELGGDLNRRVYSDVASFADVGESDDKEDAFIEDVRITPMMDLRGTLDGSRDGSDDELIFNPADPDNNAWKELATQAKIKDFVFLQLLGKTFHGYRLLGRYQGRANSSLEPHIILFLKRIPGATHRSTAAMWQNQWVPREKLPDHIAALLNADPDSTPPETTTPEGS
jgi:hypothetical protein